MQKNRSTLVSRIQGPSKSTLLDIGLVGTIVLVVSIFHFSAPSYLQFRMALDYEHVNVMSLFTSAFVHHSNKHLLNNLTGYLIAVSIAYALTRQVGLRRWFRAAVVTHVILLPCLVNFSSYIALTSLAPEMNVYGRGFSGVVAGYVGFAFVALLIWIQKRHSSSTAWHTGVIIFLALILELSVIYTGTVSLEIGLLASVGFSLNGWQLLSKSSQSAAQEPVREVFLDGIFVILLGIMIGLLIFALFPAKITIDDTTTNIVAHGIGFVYGVIVSGIVYSLTTGGYAGRVGVEYTNYG